MEVKIAKLISVIMHPLALPCYVLIILLNHRYFVTLSLPVNLKLLLTGTVCITTVLFPLFTIWMMYRLGFIRSLSPDSREERLFPLLTVALFYYITYYLLKGFHVSSIFSFFMLGMTVLVILALILNFYFRISLHLTGAGALTGLVAGLLLNFGLSLFPELLITILIGGIAAYSQLVISGHTPGECYTGYFLGAAGMTVMILLL